MWRVLRDAAHALRADELRQIAEAEAAAASIRERIAREGDSGASLLAAVATAESYETAAERLRSKHKFQGAPEVPHNRRPFCGAMNRQGEPCRARALWDKERDLPVNGRCKSHGGMSTGPRTEEGKRRCQEGLRAARERRQQDGAEAPPRPTPAVHAPVHLLEEFRGLAESSRVELAALEAKFAEKPSAALQRRIKSTQRRLAWAASTVRALESGTWPNGVTPA